MAKQGYLGRTVPIFKDPLGVLSDAKPQPQPWLVIPKWFSGSNDEWAIYWALTKLMGPEGYGNWVYQANLIGGRKLLGGAVADFYIPSEQLVIRAQGVYFHYGMGEAKMVSDQLQKQALESAGFIVVDIDEDDALRNPIYYTKEALAGRDHSRAARGL